MRTIILILLIPIPSILLVLVWHHPDVAGVILFGLALAYVTLAFGVIQARKYKNHRDGMEWLDRWLVCVGVSLVSVLITGAVLSI